MAARLSIYFFNVTVGMFNNNVGANGDLTFLIVVSRI